MISLVKFLVVFLLGWVMAVWVYNVQLPVESLKGLINHKIENIKHFKLLGMRLFETPKDTKGTSLPNEVNP